MGQTPSLVVSNEDFQKITALFAIAKREIVDLLEEELNRAKLVPSDELPSDVVSMGSKVTFVDLDTHKEQTMTLVYPHESDIESNKVSIFAPVGAALIGLKVGQTIEWPITESKIRRIKVLSVER